MSKKVGFRYVHVRILYIWDRDDFDRMEILDILDIVFCFQAEDGIRVLVRSRGLGDVYKRQVEDLRLHRHIERRDRLVQDEHARLRSQRPRDGYPCLLYTSDAADDLLCVDLGGRRILKKKKTKQRKYCESTSPTSHFIMTFQLY